LSTAQGFVSPILDMNKNTCVMKKILVPCDFSKQAINAYRNALDLAAQSKGTIHVLHVIELPILHDTVLMPVLNFEEELLKELQENAIKEFKKLKDKYSADGVRVAFDVRFGAVTNTIQDYIKEKSIDLVIMGSHGASGAREFFIGSNAEKMVRNSPVPVLILKDYYKGPVKKIVFPNTLDTENQEDLVMKVKALQNFFKAHVYIVWVNTPLNFTPDNITLDRLNKFAKRFMFKDFSTHVFNYTEEEQGILQFTQMIGGNLIAMGTHGRKGIAHVVNGSLAEDVVNHTQKPVWTYSLKKETVKG
jgi:nucleotide-binding universal stress UspA family protein